MNKRYRTPSIAEEISAVSIQDDLKNQRSQRQEYLLNLKRQCEIRQNALLTAQSLIKVYQKQNQVLKQENGLLRSKIISLEVKIQKLEKHDHDQLKNYQKNLLKFSERMNELLQANINLQQKNSKLTKLTKQKNKKTEESQINKNKLKNIKIKLRQKEEQRQFKAQLSHKNRNSSAKFNKGQYLPHTPQSKLSGNQKIFNKTVDKQFDTSQRKILEWKLKQKDEEVVILLKRLKYIEEQTQQKKVENKHFDSVQVYSTKQSKRLNLSDLYE